MVAEMPLLAGKILHPFLFFSPFSIFILPSHFPSSYSVSINLFLKPVLFCDGHKSGISYTSLGVLMLPSIKLTKAKEQVIVYLLCGPTRYHSFLFIFHNLIQEKHRFFYLSQILKFQYNFEYVFFKLHTLSNPDMHQSPAPTLYHPFGNFTFYLFRLSPSSPVFCSLFIFYFSLVEKMSHTHILVECHQYTYTEIPDFTPLCFPFELPQLSKWHIHLPHCPSQKLENYI